LRGLSFIIEDELYTADVTSVMKVIRNMAVTSVPAVSESVIGIINLKGMVVTILCLPALLGYKRKEKYGESDLVNAVIFKPLTDGSDQMGLLIDSPGELIDIDDDEIQALPLNVSYEEKNTISGLSNVDGRLYRIIDIISIVNRFSESSSVTAQNKQQEEHDEE